MGNDLPALTGNSPKLYTWIIPNALHDMNKPNTRLRLRNGSVGFLLAHCTLLFDASIEDIQSNYNDGELDDWGYAYRPIRGYSTISNHAKGAAIDLNATEHPLGKEGTFTPEEEKRIRAMLARYEGCIRWGGDYRGRKDEMHFEIDRPLKECERVARKLMNSMRGKRVLELNPTQRKVILS